MCLGEKLERGERESAQNLLLFLQNEGFGGIYRGKLTLQLLRHLVWSPATLADIRSSGFYWTSFKRIFDGLPGLRLS